VDVVNVQPKEDPASLAAEEAKKGMQGERGGEEKKRGGGEKGGREGGMEEEGKRETCS
jgi:hypothetical protein